MKAKLNITIDQDILDQMKQYALHQKTSISEIVESYFRLITAPKRKESFVEMIDRLPKLDIDLNLDLKEEYYRAKGKKYGL
ncbi:DUF6364 family protein [Daejeonella sp. JGW-45]|uniref:DUF6364 family protein n=1 Tax=Daejeonella sp. JGW-45 TaxID=3034148 RepID=UPI0023ED123B|nr:DUF6364 family protein [Daejeonella sp. JGW-45]